MKKRSDATTTIPIVIIVALTLGLIAVVLFALLSQPHFVPLDRRDGKEERAALSLSAPSKVYAGEEFEVILTANNIQVDRISLALIKDGAEQALPAGLSSKGGVTAIDEPGVYTLEAAGHDGSGNVLDVQRCNLLVVFRTDGQPLAGSTGGVNRRAVYNWSEKYIYEKNEAMLQNVLEALSCDTVYQFVATDLSDETVLAYLARRAEHGQQVVYLCGEPSWAQEDDAESMLKELERVIEYNRMAEENGGAGFYGIQYDIERLNKEKTVDQLVENYKRVYEIAREYGIRVEACIDYSLDSYYGFESQLEDLIANGCDGVAVMNYYRRDSEARHISNELALCRKYGKQIVNITEMQPIGSHDLTADNTYNEDGIEAVEQMWKELQSVFDYELGFAWHDMNAMVELIQ